MHGTNVDPRELALQIVDIVALRPEVEICYMGIANKCFEILENRRSRTESWPGRPDSHLGMNGGNIEDDGAAGSDAEDDDDDEDADGTAEAADDAEEAEENAEADTETDDDEEEYEGSDSSSDSGGRGAARLRLREILFYDDKVAIFKARHGRL